MLAVKRVGGRTWGTLQPPLRSAVPAVPRTGTSTGTNGTSTRTRGSGTCTVQLWYGVCETRQETLPMHMPT